MKTTLCSLTFRKEFILKYLTIILFVFTVNAVKAQFSVNNDATQDNCNCYTLTTDAKNKSGSVWNNNMISLNNSFDYTFKVYLGNHNDGADGIAFVLQPISTSVGSTGGGLGYSGITPAMGITIDTYQNAGDPAEDHIAIQKNGDVGHSGGNNLAGPVSALANNGDIEDGQFHVLRIVWDATTFLLSAYIDGDLRVSTTVDMVNSVFNGVPNVYWGFTGSTGGSTNLQRFCTQNLAEFQLDTLQSNFCGYNSTVVFDDASSSFGSITEWAWDFGDGNTSTQQNPSNTYATPGTYLVKLTVKGNDGCFSDEKQFNVKIHPIDTIIQTIALCDNATYELPDNQIVSTPGSYPFTLTSTVSGCDSIVIYNIIPPEDFTVSNDQNICKGESVTLNASDALSYTWSPATSLSDANIQNPVATPNTTTTYSVTAKIQIGNNLVTNGGFESGFTNFTSSYKYKAPGVQLDGPGYFTVATTIPNGWWAGCGDHTSGTGNLIIADGANGTNGVPAQSPIWCQTISVAQNTDYAFSTWLTNSNSNNQPSQLGFFINGVQVGTTQNTPISPCNWNQFYVVWNSGSNTTIDICIREMSGAQPGNDFAIDDIEFYQICDVTKQVTVNVSNIQLQNDNTSNVKCYNGNDGEITFHATDGIGNYNYTWQESSNPPQTTTNTTISNLTAGSYQIIASDDGNCKDTISVTIQQPTTPLNVTASIDNVIDCSDSESGGATATASGGTPNYQFKWDNNESTASATHLSGGQHTVIVTDQNGCQAQATVDITITQAPTVTISVQDGCQGDNVNFNSNSQAPQGETITNYQWTITKNGAPVGTNTNTSFSDNYNQAGSYSASLTVTSSNGCTKTATSNFSIFDNPDIDIDQVAECFQNVTFTAVSNNNASLHYQWDINNNGSIDNEEASFDFHFMSASPSEIKLIALSDQGCKSEIVKPIDIKAGMANIIFPNVLSLESSVGNNKFDFEKFAPNFNSCVTYTLNILNRWGVTVFTVKNDKNNPDLDCSDCFQGKTSAGQPLASGTYFYELKGDYDIQQSGFFMIIGK